MSKTLISKVVFTLSTPRYISTRGQASVVAGEFTVSFVGIPGLELHGSFWGTPKDADDKASALRFKPSLKGTAAGIRKAVTLTPELQSEIIAEVESKARDWAQVREMMLSATRTYRLGPPSKVKNDGISLDESTGNEIETDNSLSLETAEVEPAQ